MGGIVGRYFREFAVVLSVAILISLLISLTTTPMMCASLLRPKREEEQGRFARASERVFNRILRGYERSLGWALRFAPIMILILLVTIGLNVYLYASIPKGFFPQQDTGRLIGFIRGDQSISFQAMKQKLDRFVEIVRADPAVEMVVVARRAAGRLHAAEDVRVPPSRRPDVADREDRLCLDAHAPHHRSCAPDARCQRREGEREVIGRRAMFLACPAREQRGGRFRAPTSSAAR